MRAKAAVILAFVALVPLAALVSAPAPAAAQSPTEAADTDSDSDGRGEEGAGFANSKGVALFFWAMAIASVAGSIFVITRRNLITAVMGMVGTFFALAALYAMLYAHFLAVIQVLVYAGAIMVLFVFVVMVVNRPEEEPWALQGLAGKSLAGLALLYLVYRLGKVLWTVKDQAHALAEPVTVGGFEFGSTKAVGKVLFTDYLFAFEAISIVLLVAVVGAIAIARPESSPGQVVKDSTGAK